MQSAFITTVRAHTAVPFISCRPLLFPGMYDVYLCMVIAVCVPFLGDRLCVSVLAVDQFGDGVEACYGIFDGDRNEEVPRLLQCTMGDVLCEELQHSTVDSVYMCNTFLTSHR